MVAFHAVETLCSAFKAAENVATANHDSHLHTGVNQFLDLFAIIIHTLWVDAIALFALERFSTELEQYSFINCFHIF